MSDSTVIAALSSALAPTIAILVTYWLARRDRGVVATKVDGVAEVAAETASVTSEKLDSIHVLVNSRLSEALARIDQLERSLGIPPDAPVPIPKEKP